MSARMSLYLKTALWSAGLGLALGVTVLFFYLSL